MTVRFGGQIAAAACFVFIASTAVAQTPDSTAQSGQNPPAQPAQQGTQSQIHNPQSEAAAAEQKANPGQQKEKKPETAEDEYERRIRLYDPLANDNDKTKGNAGGKTSGSATKNGSATGGAKGDGAAQADDATGGSALPGPAVAGGDGAEAAGVYSGPAVLSRSYTLLRPAVPTQENWRFILGVNGIYDSGLNGVVVNNGRSGLTNTGSEGVGLFWGVSGRKYIHRDIFGLSYRGDYSQYWPGTSYSGTNQSLGIDYSHAFSPRLVLTLVEAGAMYSQNYAIESPAAAAQGSVVTSDVSANPNIEIFDNGLKQLTTSADLTYQRTARLSFDAGASWFGVKRNASYLVGSTGESGRVNGAYRLNRRQTVGLAVSYNKYAFPHGLGRSQFMDYSMTYSWAISRSTQLRAMGGAARLDSRGLATVYLPADIADLLGQQSALTQYHSVGWVSEFSAQLSRDFRRGRSASLSFARGVSPGNGLFLTSIQNTATASGSLIFHRRYYASFGAGYDSLSAASVALNGYRSAFAFAGVSRDLRPNVQANLRFDYRHYLITNAPLLQNVFRISAGVSWSSGEGLFRLW